MTPMMIRLTCSVCGDVQLDPRKFQVLNVVDSRAYYLFRCPECTEPQSGYFKAELLPPLIRAGVRRHKIPDEALEKHTGEPISFDDLIEFHFLLENSENPCSAGERDST